MYEQQIVAWLARKQENINRMWDSGRLTFDDIKSLADQAHWFYPQYLGHWNAARGWQLARVTQDVTTKRGVAFKAGDIVIAKKSGFLFSSEWTVYSVRNRCNTGLSHGVELLAQQAQ